MIKKILLIATFFTVCTLSYSQVKVDQLFKEFAQQEHAVKVKMGKVPMFLASIVAPEARGINGVEVLALTDCNQEVKERLDKAVKELKDSAYETMVTHNEDGQRVKILVKMEGKLIRELVVVTTGDDYALVRVKGKISPEYIKQYTDK